MDGFPFAEIILVDIFQCFGSVSSGARGARRRHAPTGSDQSKGEFWNQKSKKSKLVFNCSCALELCIFLEKYTTRCVFSIF